MLGWSPSLGARSGASAVTGGTSSGVPVTTGAANTKGSWTSIVTATGAWGSLGIDLNPLSGAVDMLVDIAKGDGTVFSILVPDLHMPAFLSFTGGTSLTLPIAVPAGATLYARASAVGASGQISIAVRGCGGVWGSPGFSRAVALYTPATQRGTSIDPGATANTKGSWVAMSAGVTQRVGAVAAVIGTDAAATRTACSWLWDIGVGGAGSQQTLVADLPLSVAVTAVNLVPHTPGPFACDLPASTAVWARSQCSIATSGRRTFDLALYGLVP